MLMEEEAKKSEENLAATVTKLAVTSKEADNILKKVKVFESKCMNNEVTIEEYDKNLRQTTKMASDNEQKLDELSRKLGVQEDELRRATERAELAEKNLKSIGTHSMLIFLRIYVGLLSSVEQNLTNLKGFNYLVCIWRLRNELRIRMN